MSNEATSGLTPSVYDVFQAQLERILAFSRQRANKRNRGFGFVSCSRGLNSKTAFDPSVEYYTGKLVLFWQPPSYFSASSPSSFVMDDVPYYWAEQYMVAEKTRRF